MQLALKPEKTKQDKTIFHRPVNTLSNAVSVIFQLSATPGDRMVFACQVTRTGGQMIQYRQIV